MNEIKKYLLKQIIIYQEMRDDLQNQEDMDVEDFEYMTLYEGIIEGLNMALMKIKQNKTHKMIN